MSSEWDRCGFGLPADEIVENVADYTYDRTRKSRIKYPRQYAEIVARNKAKREAINEQRRRKQYRRLSQECQQRSDATIPIPEIVSARIDLQITIRKVGTLALPERQTLRALLLGLTTHQDWNAIRRLRRKLA